MEICQNCQTYQPPALTFAGEYLLEFTHTTSDGSCEISGEALLDIGEWAQIQIIPYNNRDLITCDNFGSVHIHHMVITGSEFRPRSDSLKLLVKVSRNYFIGERDLLISKRNKVDLGVSKGQRIILTQIDEDMIKRVKSIEIAPLQPNQTIKYDQIPEIVYVGQKFSTIPVNSYPHCLYGNIFQQFQHWKVLKINGSTSRIHSFIYQVQKAEVIVRGREIDDAPISPDKFMEQTQTPNIFKTNETLKSQLLLLKRSIQYYLQDKLCPILITGPSGCGRRAIIRKAALTTGFHLIECSMFEAFSLPKLQEFIDTHKHGGPTIIHFRHFAPALKLMTYGQSHIIDKIQDKLTEILTTHRQQPVAFIFSTSGTVDLIPSGIRNLFHTHIAMKMPTLDERISSLTTLSQFYKLKIDCEDIAKQGFIQQTPGKNPI